MGHEYQRNGNPDHHAIRLIVRATQEPQVANQQGNLEEAYSQLVKRATCKIDSCIWNEILFRSVGDGKAKAVSCLCLGQSMCKMVGDQLDVRAMQMHE